MLIPVAYSYFAEDNQKVAFFSGRSVLPMTRNDNLSKAVEAFDNDGTPLHGKRVYKSEAGDYYRAAHNLAQTLVINGRPQGSHPSSLYINMTDHFIYPALQIKAYTAQHDDTLLCEAENRAMLDSFQARFDRKEAIRLLRQKTDSMLIANDKLYEKIETPSLGCLPEYNKMDRTYLVTFDVYRAGERPLHKRRGKTHLLDVDKYMAKLEAQGRIMVAPNFRLEVLDPELLKKPASLPQKLKKQIARKFGFG